MSGDESASKPLQMAGAERGNVGLHETSPSMEGVAKARILCAFASSVSPSVAFSAGALQVLHTVASLPAAANEHLPQPAVHKGPSSDRTTAICDDVSVGRGKPRGGRQPYNCVKKILSTPPALQRKKITVNPEIDTVRIVRARVGHARPVQYSFPTGSQVIPSHGFCAKVWGESWSKNPPRLEQLISSGNWGPRRPDFFFQACCPDSARVHVTLPLMNILLVYM